MKLVKIGRDIPLIGCIAFGVIDRGTDLIEVRPSSVCNLKCIYCSTNSNNPEVHPANYEVELDYLLDYVKEVVNFKEVPVECHIDSVGETMAYPKIIELVKGIKRIKNVKKISMQTNGSFLTKDNIKKLEKAGLNQINLSINTLDVKLAKKIAGIKSYNLSKVLEAAENVSKSKIGLILTPVWLPKLNEMKDLIELAKKLDCRIGIQKYEVYKYSRKIKSKPTTFWKFYDQLREWEKKYGIKLILTKKDVDVHKAKRLPTKFDKNEKAQLEVKCEGWWKGQMLGVGKNRVVSINNCKAKEGDLVNVKILENKNNIYLAEMI